MWWSRIIIYTNYYGLRYPLSAAVLNIILTKLSYILCRLGLTLFSEEHILIIFPFNTVREWVTWYRILKETDMLPVVKRGKSALKMTYITEWHFLNNKHTVIPEFDIKNRVSAFSNVLQYPMFFIPGIPAKEIYDAVDIPELEILSENQERIRDEVLNKLQDYNDYIDEKGQRHSGWKVFHLYLNNNIQMQHAAMLPVTMSIIDKIPCIEKSFIMISRIESHMHIPRHVGPYNGILRVHLSVQIPEKQDECYINIGTKRLNWHPDTLAVFDDSFEHEVFNNTDEQRIVLFLNIWHPVLNEQERTVIQKLYNHLHQSATFKMWEGNQLSKNQQYREK